jgi:hypothetical protein
MPSSRWAQTPQASWTRRSLRPAYPRLTRRCVPVLAESADRAQPPTTAETLQPPTADHHHVSVRRMDCSAHAAVETKPATSKVIGETVASYLPLPAWTHARRGTTTTAMELPTKVAFVSKARREPVVRAMTAPRPAPTARPEYMGLVPEVPSKLSTTSTGTVTVSAVQPRSWPAAPHRRDSWLSEETVAILTVMPIQVCRRRFGLPVEPRVTTSTGIVTVKRRRNLRPLRRDVRSVVASLAAMGDGPPPYKDAESLETGAAVSKSAARWGRCFISAASHWRQPKPRSAGSCPFKKSSAKGSLRVPTCCRCPPSASEMPAHNLLT